MDAPLVTVVIPAFNAAATIAAAIASVPAGPWPIEIVVVDDASTDDTRAAADRCRRAGCTVTVLGLARNRGPAGARNAGIRIARGAFVGFLDSDDRYGPQFLSGLLGLFLANPQAGVAVCGMSFVDCPRPIHPVQLAAVLNSSPCNILVRREVVELVGGFPEDPAFRGPLGGEDMAFRRTLRRHFVEARHDRGDYIQVVRPGNHLDVFLSRSTVRDGKLVIPSEEGDGAAAADRIPAWYADAVRRRLAAARKLGRD